MIKSLKEWLYGEFLIIDISISQLLFVTIVALSEDDVGLQPEPDYVSEKVPLFYFIKILYYVIGIVLPVGAVQDTLNFVVTKLVVWISVGATGTTAAIIVKTGE
jgi:hypothetical protein